MKGITASRRGFLKFGAGAAVAGPSAAKSVLERPLAAIDIDGVRDGVSASAQVGNVAYAHSDYDEDGGYTLTGAQKRVKELLLRRDKITRQRILREVQDSGAALRAEELRIDGLRSVAPAHKARMIMDSYVDARMRRKQFWLSNEMDEIIEKYPALALMFRS